MREYKTQMEAARKGIVTEELKKVAQKEHMRVEELMPLVAAGKVAICANKNHKCLDPQGVGSMLRTKINVNLGVSRDWKDYDIEMQKVMAAVDMGADAIMDLSSHGDTTGFRRKLTSECPAMIGTVPVYDSVIHYQRDLATLTAKDFIDVVRLHAEDGVDFVTLHCGITRKTIDQIKNHKRKMNIVSRGGSLVFAWMTMTGEENPFYEYYDEILDICREYDVTISLGDACRPGCLADASDVCQIEELVRLGELTKRAWEKDVQVMVEGPGHMPMDQIAANMKIQQTICMGAPFYVLGPLVTDIAPGYDHITSAIGGAIAAANGAAFLCYVTPAEHLALPNVDDVKQGIMASKIAAHAADIAKHVPGAMEMDNKMADARRVLDWEAQWACAMDPETAKAIRADRAPEHYDECTRRKTWHQQLQIVHILSFGTVEEHEIPGPLQAGQPLCRISLKGGNGSAVRRPDKIPMGCPVSSFIQFDCRQCPLLFQKGRHNQGGIANAGTDFQQPFRPCLPEDPRHHRQFCISQDGQLLPRGLAAYLFQKVRHGIYSFTFFI